MSNSTEFPKDKSLDLADERLEAIAKDIETTEANATFHIAAQLAEARDIFRYRRDEGGFGGWVKTRLGYSRSEAYSLLNVHERFGGGGNLSKRLDTFFPDTILYRLAAPSTPDKVCDEIISRAQAGETLTLAGVERAIDAAKGKPKSNKPKKKALDHPPKPPLSDDFESDAALTAAAADVIARLSGPALARTLERGGLKKFLEVLQALPPDWIPELTRFFNTQQAIYAKHHKAQVQSVREVTERLATTH